MRTLAVVLCFLLARNAIASPPDYDVAVDTTIPLATAPSNWGGWYVGGSVGFSWGSSDVSYEQEPFSVFGFDFARSDSGFGLTNKLHPKSGTGGLQAGYDFQRGQIVLGVVTDFDYRNGSAKTLTGPMFPPLNDFLSISTVHEWLGTARVRAGLQLCKACLLYTTGGLAYGRVHHAHVQTSVTIIDRSFDSHRAFSESQTKVGWTVGGGLEYRFNQTWSIGAEYLYVDLGSDTVKAGAGPGNDLSGYELFYPATTVSYDDTSSIARVVLNYRFGGP